VGRLSKMVLVLLIVVTILGGVMGCINSDAVIGVKLPRPGGGGSECVERSKVENVCKGGNGVDGFGEVLGAVSGLALLGAFDGVDFSPP